MSNYQQNTFFNAQIKMSSKENNRKKGRQIKAKWKTSNFFTVQNDFVQHTCNSKILFSV